MRGISNHVSLRLRFMRGLRVVGLAFLHSTLLFSVHYVFSKMGDLHFHKCQGHKSKNCPYEDSHRSSVLRTQLLQVHREMHQITSGMFGLNSQILEYLWFQVHGLMYWQLRDYNLPTSFSGIWGSGWPSYLV